MALVQHWKCQDNSASTTVIATVGTNGTLVGGDNTSDRSVVDGPGTAYPLAFDLLGVDEAVDISASSISFASGSPFSLMFWSEHDSNAVSFTGVSGSIGPSRIRKSNDTTIIYRGASGGDITFTVASMGLGTYRHIAITRDSSDNVRCFVDGVESSTGALNNTTTFAPEFFGSSGTQFANCRIADVRVYNSDESANLATIIAEKDTAAGGHPASRRLAMCRDNETGVIVI